MPAACVRLIEYQTADGVVLRIEVSAAIAAALMEEESSPREAPFTDVRVRGTDGKTKPLDPELLDPRTANRRVSQRPMPQGNPWEGPRFAFSLFLGEHRPGWNGGISIDERGRCGICHGARLPGYAVCLSCDRTGRDAEIPRPTERDMAARGQRRAYSKGKLKGGCEGKR